MATYWWDEIEDGVIPFRGKPISVLSHKELVGTLKFAFGQMQEYERRDQARMERIFENVNTGVIDICLNRRRSLCNS